MATDLSGQSIEMKYFIKYLKTYDFRDVSKPAMKAGFDIARDYCWLVDASTIGSLLVSDANPTCFWRCFCRHVSRNSRIGAAI